MDSITPFISSNLASVFVRSTSENNITILTTSHITSKTNTTERNATLVYTIISFGTIFCFAVILSVILIILNKRRRFGPSPAELINLSREREKKKALMPQDLALYPIIRLDKLLQGSKNTSENSHDTLDTDTTHDISNQTVDCMICFEDIDPEDDVRSIPCRHPFHAHCLQLWLERNGFCPTCRFDLRVTKKEDQTVQTGHNPRAERLV
ncbi:hypothetical protein BB558_003689 [Smittium angustum]|uniref:RING-type domain-containing protein n=1 Tax=Smittium angustum TaxID=133377 RepID=A0A2U1J5H8_SMIAN|nr:hypothetical protein BB558_003689 [Smittium angustum]